MIKSKRYAKTRSWSNQNQNPALRTKTGNYWNYKKSQYKENIWSTEWVALSQKGCQSSTQKSEAVLTCTHNLCFEQKYENSQNFSTENCHFTYRGISLYIAWECLRHVSWWLLSIGTSSGCGVTNGCFVSILITSCIILTDQVITGWERTVHTTLCLDLYSEQILVSCYDLEDGQCFLSVYLIFWT